MKQRIRKHFAEHGKTYLYVIGGVIVGSAVTYILIKKPDIFISTEGDYSPVAIDGATVNQVLVEMVRPGPMAYVIQCDETQSVYPSIRSAAEALGVWPTAISEYLKGNRSDVNGFHFTKITEI